MSVDRNSNGDVVLTELQIRALLDTGMMLTNVDGQPVIIVARWLPLSIKQQELVDRGAFRPQTSHT